MDISTVKGAPYVVSNTTGAEIEVQSAGGAVLCKVPATSQAAVYAVDEALVVPDGVVVTAARFNGASLAVLGGGEKGGSGTPEGDYLTFDENNVVTGGRLNNQTVISFVQYERSGLTSWNIPLPKVSTAQQAFFNAGLTEWNIEMPELRNATSMLYGNKNMTALRAAFSNVEQAVTMCYSCAKLEVVECILEKLTNGRAAFCQCPKLTRANGYMPKLIDGEMLFSATPMCVVENANFSSLSNGFNLFNGGRLDKESALGVLNTIPSWTSGTHKLVIGIHIDHQTDDEVLAAIEAAQLKGWAVTVQWNGTPTAQASVTYGLRTPPIYARVEERNGEKILEWGHYVSDPTGYEEFRSVEAAREYFGIEEN